jgi:hypothetical protein
MVAKVFVEKIEKIKIRIHIMYFDMACCEENTIFDLMIWKKKKTNKQKLYDDVGIFTIKVPKRTVE